MIPARPRRARRALFAALALVAVALLVRAVWSRETRPAALDRSNSLRPNAQPTPQPRELAARAGAPRKTSTLSGHVVDATGGPVASATVQLIAAEGGVVSALSDELGAFQLAADEGPCELKATAEGYASARRSVYAPAGQLVLELMPEAVLRGRVVRAESSEPVVGIPVRVRLVRTSESSPVHLDVVQSGEDGEFRVGGLPPGRYAVRAESATASSRPDQLVVLGAAEQRDALVLRVQRATVVAGTIWSGGAPCRSGFFSLSESYSQSVRADGAVRIEGVPAGRHDFVAECEGALTLRGSLSVPDGGIQDGRWVLEQGLAVHGRVIHHDGSPAANTAVTATPRSFELRSRASTARTDADGRFSVTGLDPTRYAISARGDHGPISEEREIDLTNRRDLHDLKLVALPLAELNVALSTAEGGPFETATVSLTTATDDARAAQPRGRGTFLFRQLLPGRYTLTVDPCQGEQRNAPFAAHVELGPGARETYRVVCGRALDRLAGRVVDEANEPVPDVLLRASRVSATDVAVSAALERTTFSGLDGSFMFEEVLAGLYRLDVEHPDYASQRGLAAKTGGEQVVVKIGRACLLAGQLRDERGRPVTQFDIIVRDEQTGGQEARTFRDRDGAFSIPGLSCGAQALVARTAFGQTRRLLRSGELHAGEPLQLVVAHGSAPVRVSRDTAAAPPSSGGAPAAPEASP